jgi:nitroreductase
MMAPDEIAARALSEICMDPAPPVDGANRAAALRLLLTRFSVSGKHLAEPGPSDEELAVIALAALRAPDHNKLIPFRFVVARGQALERLADLFADYGRRRGKTGEALKLERARAMQAPVAIAVIARIVDGDPEVPRHEQWATVGGAISNALTAAHFLGYAGKMLSGARAADPLIARAYCTEGEDLLGWISIGTSTRPAIPRGEIDPGHVLRFM